MEKWRKYSAVLGFLGAVVFLSAFFLFQDQAKACEGCRACEMGASCGCGCKMTEIFTPAEARADEMAVDPVCGMKVDPRKSRENGLVYRYKGKDYYFCMKGDLEKFKRDPEKYLSEKSMMHSGTSGKEVDDMCSKMDAIHEKMMGAYAEVIDLQAKLEKEKNIEVADRLYTAAKTFMDSVNETHALMGRMKVEQSHFQRTKKAFQSLEDSRRKLLTAVSPSKREKAWADFLRSVKEFSTQMKMCHEMEMRHMEMMGSCEGKGGHHHHH